MLYVILSFTLSYIIYVDHSRKRRRLIFFTGEADNE